MRFRNIAAAAFLSAALPALSAPVSPEEALKAAAAWMKNNPALGCDLGSSADDVTAHPGRDGKGTFYLVATKKPDGSAAGFIAVSADRRLNPVMGFFEGGAFETADSNPAWTMLTLDAAGCAAALEDTDAAAATNTAVRALGAKKSKHEQKWAELLGESSGARSLGSGHLESVSDLRVPVLLETTWRQSGSGFDYYTPVVNGRRCVCGCVATAGSQILRYWKYPTGEVVKPAGLNLYDNIYSDRYQGTKVGGYNLDYGITLNGTTTPLDPPFGGVYDWANMPANGGSTETQKKAIGRLTRDVGMSCFVGYSPIDSGGPYYAFHDRLLDVFQYANAACIRNTSVSAADIAKAIIPSLNLKSPCGVSVPGHAIVADGYGYNDGTLYVHFNLGWSWGGWWYNPPDLTDASGSFTAIQAIMYNIYPPSVSTIGNCTIVSGRVLDSTGNVLAGVAVTARNKSTGATFTANSDSRGIYAIPVPAATYTLSASRNGVIASLDRTVSACITPSSGSLGPGAGGTVNNIYDADLTVNRLPAPVFTKQSGAVMEDHPENTTIFDGYVPLGMSCAVSGATIRYTTDGSEPTASSPVYSASSKPQIRTTCTVKAKAFMSGYVESATASIMFNKLSPAGNLIVNPGFETCTVTQNSGNWSYSTGSGFECPAWTFSSGCGLSAPNTTWIANVQGLDSRAAFIQTSTAGTQSELFQRFAVARGQKIYKIAFSYAARPGRAGATTRVQLINGATTNELASVTSSATAVSQYTGTVLVPSASAGYILRFVQDGTGADQANIIDNVVFQLAEQTPAPEIAPKDGTRFFGAVQNVTMSCAADDAEIRYTTDGSEPTQSSALYTGPVAISATTQFKAKTFRPGEIPGETVQAKIAHAALLGGNLIKNPAPTGGEKQTIETPAAGTYALAFSYAGAEGRYGEPAEIVLTKGGETVVAATVAATGAGTVATNLTFELPSAGAWELEVRPSGAQTGTSAVAVSNLEMAIPATEENAKLYWVYESPLTLGTTGTWDAWPEIDGGYLDINGVAVFTPASAPAGRVTTFDVTAVFAHAARSNDQGREDSKAALRIGYQSDDTDTLLTFQALVRDGDTNAWLNVAAPGAGMPQTGVPYRFRIALDCAAETYGVTLLDGETERPLESGGARKFAFPCASAGPVETLRFEGSGLLALVSGSYADPPRVYEAGETLPLSGGASATLTDAQAAWLNSLADYEAVKSKAAGMGARDFDAAWLLNLDITQTGAGLAAFKVSKIEVLDAEVKVHVSLSRTGAVQTGEESERRDAPVNGILKMYGGAKPGDKTLLVETKIEGADFGNGTEAVFTFPRSGAARFFRPAITAPPAQ